MRAARRRRTSAAQPLRIAVGGLLGRAREQGAIGVSSYPIRSVDLVNSPFGLSMLAAALAVPPENAPTSIKIAPFRCPVP
jgi:hypothetical protein